ncbi:hypothetical protein [Acinetobacter bereziniae]|uniref:hypothetical protein n=1 Tax=Acinetobacter bereziniae TaxID=106648 RepID=UPI00124FDD0D|nr:hypothetical protein [Acinetobacter bereziniae]
MKTINIEFMNESVFEITVIVEPLADEFLLKTKDTIKVVCESLEEITTIHSAFMDKETVVIWLPRGNIEWRYYINDCLTDPF